MALTAQEREDVAIRLWRDGNFPPTVLKADLRAAVAAVDDWVDANQASYNAALPQPFRGASNASQKAAVLTFVLRRRFGDPLIRNGGTQN